jgi:hypothetical protein
MRLLCLISPWQGQLAALIADHEAHHMHGLRCRLVFLTVLSLDLARSISQVAQT